MSRTGVPSNRSMPLKYKVDPEIYIQQQSKFHLLAGEVYQTVLKTLNNIENEANQKVILVLEEY